jgi:hypothetical protein
VEETEVEIGNYWWFTCKASTRCEVPLFINFLYYQGARADRMGFLTEEVIDHYPIPSVTSALVHTLVGTLSELMPFFFH